jgi:hypothetical protein
MNEAPKSKRYYKKYPLMIIRPTTGLLADQDLVIEIIRHMKERPRVLDLTNNIPPSVRAIVRKLQRKNAAKAQNNVPESQKKPN